MDIAATTAPRSDQQEAAVEKWRAVPGYHGYEVSSLGNVRSLNRVTGRGRRWRGKTMTPNAMKNGYMLVSLWRQGHRSSVLVHRLVLQAFIGPAASNQEARHGNGVRRDNRLSNLSWGSHSDNQLDQVLHGTHDRASRTHCPAGHPYDAANTYVYPNGRHRGCRSCRTEHARASVLRRRSVA